MEESDDGMQINHLALTYGFSSHFYNQASSILRFPSNICDFWRVMTDSLSSPDAMREIVWHNSAQRERDDTWGGTPCIHILQRMSPDNRPRITPPLPGDQVDRVLCPLDCSTHRSSRQLRCSLLKVMEQLSSRISRRMLPTHFIVPTWTRRTYGYSGVSRLGSLAKPSLSPKNY
jgi:hypothetical protein